MAKFLGTLPRFPMLDPKPTGPGVEQRLLPPPDWSAARRQQRFMVASLALLLGALALILYRDRDFWFPTREQAADTPLQQNPVTNTMTSAAPSSVPVPLKAIKTRGQHPARESTVESPVAVQPPPPVVVSARKILPPLEVEVLGEAPQTARPGSNSVKVDLQSHPAFRAAAQPPIEIHSDPTVAPTNAAERGHISTAAATMVTESVRPDYPMLARQMKVQGSVILQALIGRDGLIQDLRVLSGPPILAAAAREAVRQWHFKPHYLGNAAVETETRITVNFTISTN